MCFNIDIKQVLLRMDNSLAKNFHQGAIQKKESDLSEEEVGVPITKKPRTSEDFYLFCKFILEYENYELIKKEEVKEAENEMPHSLQNTIDSATQESEKEEVNGGTVVEDIPENISDNQEVTDLDASVEKTNDDCEAMLGNLSCRNNTESSSEVDDRKSPISVDEFESSDEDSYDLVTCFCRKPFAGRPMIECSKCLTWIHLSCAKVKKTQIPDVYICPSCKDPPLF